MTMILSSLEQCRASIKTGAVLTYGRSRGPGQWIESFTGSDQSHVSTAVANGPLLMVAEAIAEGAVIRPLTFNWQKADDVWLLPLGGPLSFALEERLLAYLADIAQRQVPYDLRALMPRVWRNGRPPEDFSRLYCSELVALGMRHMGLYQGTVELTPVEVCRLAVYAEDYYCLKWDDAGPKEIEGYNTVDPSGDPFSHLPPAGAPQ